MSIFTGDDDDDDGLAASKSFEKRMDAGEDDADDDAKALLEN